MADNRAAGLRGAADELFLVRPARSRPRTADLVRAFGWADLPAIVPLFRIFRRARLDAPERALLARRDGADAGALASASGDTDSRKDRMPAR